MIFNANKKNKEQLYVVNKYIDRLEDIKLSNKYGEWTVDDEIVLQNARIKKEQFELTIQTNRETYLKNIITLVCASAIGGALAYIANKR